MSTLSLYATRRTTTGPMAIADCFLRLLVVLYSVEFALQMRRLLLPIEPGSHTASWRSPPCHWQLNGDGTTAAAIVSFHAPKSAKTTISPCAGTLALLRRHTLTPIDGSCPQEHIRHFNTLSASYLVRSVTRAVTE